jgi:GNAT superfamily N-acetyltransferase
VVEAADGARAARAAEAVLRSLPEWVGLEEPLLAYIEAARTLPTLVATDGTKDVGFLTLARHNVHAAEIVAMGVTPDRHRRGLGRRLVEAAVGLVAADGVCLLQVKTLGPSHPSAGYARTRAFYTALGFVPLEETTAIWGDANPCLIMVRPLS